MVEERIAAAESELASRATRSEADDSTNQNRHISNWR